MCSVQLYPPAGSTHLLPPPPPPGALGERLTQLNVIAMTAEEGRVCLTQGFSYL